MSCSPMKKAAEHMQHKEYFYAIEDYQKVLKKHPENAEANYRLAEALRKINRINEALPYYRRAITQYPEATPYYIESLKSNKNYAKARQVVDSLSNSNYSEEIRTQLSRLQEQLNELQSLQKEDNYYHIKVVEGINSDQAEYAPVVHDSWMYFVSTKRQGKTYAATGQPYSALFRVKVNDDRTLLLATLEQWNGNKFNINQANTGPVAIYPHGNAIVFARGNTAKSKSKRFEEVDLFYSQYKRKKWTQPKRFSVSDTKILGLVPCAQQRRAESLLLFYKRRRLRRRRPICGYTISKRKMGIASKHGTCH